MANYVDQINLNGNVGDIKGCGDDRYYPGVDLTTQFASEIAGYSDPWAWIKARISAGDFSKLHVADYIPVTCTNGTKFNARIAGINTYKGYGDTAVGNHIDFISASVWPTTFKMNLKNFNNGLDADHQYPWLSSNGYHFLNSLAGNVPNGTGNLPETEAVDYTAGGVYFFLPDALKNVITAATTFDISNQKVCDILVDALTDLDQPTSLEMALWWYSESTEYYNLVVTKNYVVGHGYYTKPHHSWDCGVQSGNRIIYVLRKEPGEGQFMVVTAYTKIGR